MAEGLLCRLLRTSKEAGSRAALRSSLPRLQRTWVGERLEGRVLLAGAALVKDIHAGVNSSDPASLINVNGMMYFTAGDASGTAMYRSDGTPGGTVRLIQPGSDFITSAAGGDTLFFARNDDLWKSDGTLSGTKLVKQFTTPQNRLQGLTDVGGTLMFVESNDGNNPLRLWKSDGTSAGTSMIVQIAETTATPKDHRLTKVGDTLYFVAYTTAGEQLWRSDGTAAGTSAVATFQNGCQTLTNIDGVLHMRVGGAWWKTDGTPGGTQPLLGTGGNPIATVQPLRIVGKMVYFLSGLELWSTNLDGGASVRVGYLGCGPRSGQVMYASDAGGRLFVGEYFNTTGHELYSTLGAANSLQLVKDINVVTNDTNGGFNGSFPDYYAALGNTMYFAAEDGINGRELWRSDGTAAGTTLAADIRTGASGASPFSMTPAGVTSGTLFFVADDGTSIGRELWAYRTADAAPLAVRAKTVSDVRVDLTWSFPETDAVAFKVQRSTDGVNFADVVRLNDPAARAYVDISVQPATKYHYRIVAVRPGEADSLPSNVSIATSQPLVPLAPAELAVATVPGSATSLQLSWLDNSGNEQAFRIERRAAGAPPAIPFVEVATVGNDVMTFTDTALFSATAYEYRVRASNTHGFSGYTDVASATTLTAATSFGPAPAAVPGIIEAEDFDFGSESIAYRDTTPGNSGNLTTYRPGTDVEISQMPDAGVSSKVVVALTGEWLNYSVDVTGGAYRFDLRTSNSSAATVHLEYNGQDITGPVQLLSNPANNTFLTISHVGSFTLPAGAGALKLVVDSAGALGASINWLRLVNAADVTAPAAPQNVAAFAVNGPATDVTWSAVPNATSYRIERRIGVAGTWTPVAPLDAGVTRYRSSALSPDTSYFYRVVAINSSGTATSAEVEISTLTAPSQLLKDISLRDASSTPASFTLMGDAVYFTTHGGTKLWRTDGTDAGTMLLTDTLTSISGLTASGGVLFFAASTAATGTELWKTDGTVTGTMLAVDVNAGTSGSFPENVTALNGGVVFTWSEKLYFSDGVSAQLVRQFGGVPFANFTPSGGKVYFTARDSANGVWRTDGTAAGTVKLLDTFSGNVADDLTDVGGTLYFSATIPNNTSALFKSDGTVAGTQQLTPSGTQVHTITGLNGTAYFLAFPPSGAGSGMQLWRSDGTAATTSLITTASVNGSGSFPASIGAAGGRLYFLMTTTPVGSSARPHLFTSDTTEAGTSYVRELPRTPTGGAAPIGPFELNGEAFFVTVNNQSSSVLWRTDGTAAGTEQLGITGSFARTTAAALDGSTIVTSFQDSILGKELFRTDGTRAGATLVKNLDTTPAAAASSSSIPQFLTTVGDSLYFTAYPGFSSGSTIIGSSPTLPGQLWRSDGTEAGTVPVTGSVIEPSRLFNLDDEQLLFIASLGSTLGVWRSDGTEAGTVFLKDLGVSVPGTTSLPNVTSMTRVGGFAYFVAGGDQLWKSDGTAAGTQLVTTLGQTGTVETVEANGRLVITIQVIVGSAETLYLWSSDGTAAGTVQLRVLQAANSSSIQPVYLTSVGGAAYFRAGENGGQRRLWRTDGTVAGTTQLTTDIDPRILTRSGNRLYFYGSGPVAGGGMYVSDGSLAGTVLLRSNVGSGIISTSATSIAPTPGDDGGAFFITGSSTTTQIYRTDGTAAGTELIVSKSNLAFGLSLADDTLFFRVSTNQIWATDGSPGNERLALSATSSSLTPAPIKTLGGRAFVVALTTGLGFEPWKLFLPVEAPDISLTPGPGDALTIDWTMPTAPADAPIGAFLVERRTSRTGPWTVVGETGPGVTTFTDSAVNPVLGYEYRVRPVNAGGASAPSNVVERVDAVAPAADVVDVSPDPRELAVASFTITFTEAVTGFDVADLTLTRDGDVVPLGAAQTLITTDNTTFILPNLAALTSQSGAYALTLTATGSGIADAAGNPIPMNASESWVHSLPTWLVPGSMASWNSVTNVLTLNGHATMTADPDTESLIINADGVGAVLTIDPTSDLLVHVGALHLSNGATATLVSLGANRTAGAHRVLVVCGLNIDSTSILDLTDNDLVLDYEGDLTTQLSDIGARLTSGRNGGAWNGGGMISSLFKDDNPNHRDPNVYGLGYADNASLPTPYGSALGGSPFGGVDVDDTAVLIKFTWFGDLNIDGLIDFQDLSVFNTNYDNGLSTGRSWFDGDFNYDGVIDFQDLSVFYTNYDPNKPAL